MTHAFPFSKNNVSLIIKEIGITKEELADIIGTMPDSEETP